MRKKAVVSLLLAASMLTACGETETTETKKTEASTSIESTVEKEETSETSEETALTEVTESPVSDTTESEETAAPTEESYRGEEFQRFLKDLQATIDQGKESRYYGPDYKDEDAKADPSVYSMQIRSSTIGFQYIYTDVDQDGVHELLLGSEHTDQEKNPFLHVNAFVVIDTEGKYKILAASWDRSSTQYLGNGYLVNYGSQGAACHVSTLYHYNSESTSLDVVAQLVKDSETTASDSLPVFYYSLYEGRKWSMRGVAKDDPDAMHGDEAKAKWDEMIEKVNAAGNELLGASWQVHGALPAPTPSPTPSSDQTNAAQASSEIDYDSNAQYAKLQYEDVKAYAREWLSKGMYIEVMNSEEAKAFWGTDGEILEGFAAGYDHDGLLQLDWVIKFPNLDAAMNFFHKLEDSFFGQAAAIAENGDGSFSFTERDAVSGYMTSDGLLILIMP